MKIKFGKGSENNPNEAVRDGEEIGDELVLDNGVSALSRREFLGMVGAFAIASVRRNSGIDNLFSGSPARLGGRQLGAEFQKVEYVPGGIALEYGAVESLTIDPNGPYDYFYKAYLEQLRKHRAQDFWGLLKSLVFVTNKWYEYFNPNLERGVQPVMRNAGLVSGRPSEVAERAYKFGIFQCAECAMMAHWAAQPGE